MSGEALAAARQAERMRQEAGLTWPDIFGVEGELGEPAQCPVTTDEAIAFLFVRRDELSPWEHDFVCSLRCRRGLTAKQLACLERILSRVWFRAEAA
jgi:hypothetical protein